MLLLPPGPHHQYVDVNSEWTYALSLDGYRVKKESLYAVQRHVARWRNELYAACSVLCVDQRSCGMDTSCNARRLGSANPCLACADAGHIYPTSGDIV